LIADNARFEHSADPVRLREAIDSISDWLAQATTEARAALNALHASVTQRNDLAVAFQRAAEACQLTSPMKCVLSVEGTAQDLHPIVRDEIYRIGSEAIRNAYLHSHAMLLEVSLCYTHNLTVRVRDHGRGMDAEVSASGKPGHFGLGGMRERATRIGGTLRLLSRPNSGTEIELVVPGQMVFRQHGFDGQAWHARLLGFFNRHKEEKVNDQ
jgi:signal transduction histidine kinase